MTVILLSGWKRSGKGTVAEYLEERYGYQHLSIAEPLKDLVAKKYGVPRDWLDDQSKKEQPLYWLPIRSADATSRAINAIFFSSSGGNIHWTPRALCILEGSIARTVNPYHWVDELVEGIKDNPDRNYVISDVRYRSEVEYLKVQLKNCRVVRISREDTVDTLDASERDLDDYPFDLTMENKGTREELYDKITATFRGTTQCTGSTTSFDITLGDGSRHTVTGPGPMHGLSDVDEQDTGSDTGVQQDASVGRPRC